MHKVLRKSYERKAGRKNVEKKVYKKPELTRQGNLKDVGQMINTTGKG